MRANKSEMIRNYLPVLRKAGDRIGTVGVNVIASALALILSCQA